MARASCSSWPSMPATGISRARCQSSTTSIRPTAALILPCALAGVNPPKVRFRYACASFQDDFEYVVVLLRLPAPVLSRPGPVPDGPGWSFEPKWDGFRAIVSTEDGIRVRSRRGWNMTHPATTEKR